MSEQGTAGQAAAQATNAPAEAEAPSSQGQPSGETEGRPEVTSQSEISITKDGRIIVDGEETTYTPKDIKRIKDLERESYKRFEEAAKARKEAEAKLANHKTPEQIKKELEQELIEEYKEAQQLEGLSEAEKELYFLKKKEAAREAAEKQKAEQETTAKQEQENAEFVNELNRSYVDYLENSIVPADSNMVDIMFRQHIAALEAGIPGVNAKFVADRAVDEFSGTFQGFVEKAIAQNKMDFILDKVLGPKALNAIRKADLARLKLAAKPKAEPKSEATEPKEKEPKPYKGRAWGMA